MIRVLIDGYALSDGSERRGIGTVLKRLIPGLAAHPEISVKVLAAPTVTLPDRAERIPLHRRAPRRLRILEHDLRLPVEVARSASDVLLSPSQHPPRRSSIPWIQTLHDLIPLTWPHPLLAADERRWKRVGQRLRQASAVVAVSQFSADEGIRHLSLDPALVRVIPPGVDHAVFHPGAATADVPYLLKVGAWGAHKGFAEALEVIARLADAGYPHRLVLAGPQDAWMMSRVHADVIASPRPDIVDVAGYVDDLAATYRGATALLMTSRSEGFGLPAVEAMACGTPVVAFANSSLPEVVGDGGVLVDDGNVDQMVRALRHLIDSPAMRTELAGRAVTRASRYQWGVTIDSYVELIRRVAGDVAPDRA